MATLLGEWGFLDNLNDTSGNGLNATSSGTALTYGAGPQANTRAVLINATDQGIVYGRTGLEPAQAAGGIVTMAWVKANAFINGYTAIINKMRAFDSTRHTLSIENGNLFYMSRWRGRLQFASVSGAFSGANLNTWFHVCNIDADDRWAILINGVQIVGAADAQSAALPAWENIPWITAADSNGATTTGNPNHWISGIRMFSGTMTNAEVVTWMNTPITSGVPSRTGKAKVWDGSAWTARQAKVWNGTSWVNRSMYGVGNDLTWTKSK